MLPDELSLPVDGCAGAMARLRREALGDRQRRLRLFGPAGSCQAHLAAALLDRMFDCAVHLLDPFMV